MRLEILARQPDYTIVFDVSGDRQHHTFGAVPPHMERMQLRPRHRRNRFGAAQHAAADRMITEQRTQEGLPQQILGIVVTHRDFFEHHITLDLDVVAGASPAQHHIGHQVYGQLQIGVQHMSVITGLLACGEGVELAPDGVDRLGDIGRRPGGRGFEQQVLEEVRRTGDTAPLVARPHVDPHADGRRAHRGHGLGDYSEPTWKNRAAYR
ncbi:Uncharacterised protein [Mycobacteroides abscessus]|nr:Uncharacterised protein [Mycobacteroides abscessus]